MVKSEEISGQLMLQTLEMGYNPTVCRVGLRELASRLINVRSDVMIQCICAPRHVPISLYNASCVVVTCPVRVHVEPAWLAAAVVAEDCADRSIGSTCEVQFTNLDYNHG